MEQEEKKRKRRRLFVWTAVVLVVLLVLAGAFIARRYYIISQAEISGKAVDTGEWFDIRPEGIVSANGEEVYTQMRLGTENKVIVMFCGGGISINEYTAARPYIGLRIADEPGFYSDDIEGMIPDYCAIGIGVQSDENPFSDWSIIVIPYTTADFHIGTTEYAYTALDGSEAVLNHHGYLNYRAIMDEAVRYTGSAPDELLICGWSAGGYATAILAPEIMEDYFPDAGHVTVCVDSSLLELDHWERIFRDVWAAPEEFTQKIHSSNLIVDFLGALYDEYGDENVTYLYIGSVRDGALTKYQSFFDVSSYTANNVNVNVYTGYLREMLRQLGGRIPSCGIYLFDSLPFSLRPTQFRLTQHTIIETAMVFWPVTDRVSVASWLYDAVEGNVTSHGLNLLR